MIGNIKTFPEKLESVILSILKYLDQNRGTLKIVFYESKMFFELVENEDSVGIRRFLEIKEKRLKKFEEFFKEGIEAGYIKEDIPVRFIVICFTGVVSEYCLDYLLTNKESDQMNIENVTKLILKVLTKGIFK